MRHGHFPHHDRIVQDPKVMLGKLVVKGTRIPVESVLEELANNLNPSTGPVAEVG